MHLEFPQSVKDKAYIRSGARCECRCRSHGHTGRCRTTLTKVSAQCHHIYDESQGGHDGLTNCELLCRSCYMRMSAYGRH